MSFLSFGLLLYVSFRWADTSETISCILIFVNLIGWLDCADYENFYCSPLSFFLLREVLWVLIEVLYFCSEQVTLIPRCTGFLNSLRCIVKLMTFILMIFKNHDCSSKGRHWLLLLIPAYRVSAYCFMTSWYIFEFYVKHFQIFTNYFKSLLDFDSKITCNFLYYPIIFSGIQYEEKGWD